jgi:hypothetical protein
VDQQHPRWAEATPRDVGLEIIDGWGEEGGGADADGAAAELEDVEEKQERGAHEGDGSGEKWMLQGEHEGFLDARGVTRGTTTGTTVGTIVWATEGAKVWRKFACGFRDRARFGEVTLAPDEGFAGEIAAGVGFECASIDELGLALFEEGGEVGAFEDFHEGVAARTEEIGEEVEHAAAEADGEEIVAVTGGVGCHVGDDDIE